MARLAVSGWPKTIESKTCLGRGGHPRRGSAPVFRKIPPVVCSETVCAFMGPSAQIRQVCSALTGRLLPRGDDRMPGTRTTSAKRWKRIPAIGKNACAIYKRMRLFYTTHMGKNGRGSIRCRIGRAKPSPAGSERMRLRLT